MKVSSTSSPSYMDPPQHEERELHVKFDVKTADLKCWREGRETIDSGRQFHKQEQRRD